MIPNNSSWSLPRQLAFFWQECTKLPSLFLNPLHRSNLISSDLVHSSCIWCRFRYFYPHRRLIWWRRVRKLDYRGCLFTDLLTSTGINCFQIWWPFMAFFNGVSVGFSLIYTISFFLTKQGLMENFLPRHVVDF